MIPRLKFSRHVYQVLHGGAAGRMIRDRLNFRIQTRVRMRLRPLNARISEFQIKWLTDKARFVRVAMRSLLKNRRGGRVSRPGEPPTRRLGFIYKMTLYAVDRAEVVAVVGPLLRRKNIQKICGILDRGGVERIKLPAGRPYRSRATGWILARYRPRPFTRPGLIKGLREYDDKRMQGKL